MLVAGGCKARAGGFVGFGYGVVAGNGFRAVAAAAYERFLSQPAAFVDFEQVNRNMLRTYLQNARDRFFPRFGRLLRKPSDQIHADVAKTRFAQNSRRRENIGSTMHAPRRLQFAVVKGLRTEADAIKSDRNPGLRFFGGNGFGVGFQSDFGRSHSRV